jgi:hypothetical protein
MSASAMQAISTNYSAEMSRPLIELLCEYNNCKPWTLDEKLEKYRSKNIDFIKSLGPLHTFNGYKVQIDDLSYKNARNLKAFRNHQCKATVEQYYFIRHKITLKYPYLPCIIVKGGKGHLYFYPIEILFVTDNLNELFDCIDLNDTSEK